MWKYNDFEESWINIEFFKIKNYKFSFGLKAMPKVLYLGHIGDNKSIAAIMNNGFTIF